MTFRSDRSILRAWAETYARMGWPVFPVVPKQKRPLTENGFHDASTDASDIARWWHNTPTANIGLPTGHAFDVLDLDSHEAVQRLDSIVGSHYRHRGPASSTGKGWHLLFQRSGLGNAAALTQSIDYRGIGGYIVAPPSIHPSGARYEWVEGHGPDIALPEVPDWLHQLHNRDDNPRAKQTVTVKVDPTQPYGMYEMLVKEGLIPETDVPRERRIALTRPDILTVCARLGLQLRKRRGYYVGKCIFHDDSTPSFTIYPDDTFHCFGCGAHGDSFDLNNDPPTHI